MRTRERFSNAYLTLDIGYNKIIQCVCTCTFIICVLTYVCLQGYITFGVLLYLMLQVILFTQDTGDILEFLMGAGASQTQKVS